MRERERERECEREDRKKECFRGQRRGAKGETKHY